MTGPAAEAQPLQEARPRGTEREGRGGGVPYGPPVLSYLSVPCQRVLRFTRPVHRIWTSALVPAATVPAREK